MKILIGQKIKELRKDKNLSQTALAQILNVTQAAVGKWETGDREPDYNTLIKIALFFDVTTDYLLGLEDESGAKYSHSFNNFNNNGTINIH